MSKEAIFDREIQPLMDKIMKICNKNKIPIFAHFELGSGLCFTACLAPFASDKFKKFTAAAKEADPPKYAGIAVMDDGTAMVTGSEGYTDDELARLVKKVVEDTKRGEA